MCKHAYLVKIFIILLSGQFWSTFGEKWQLSTLVLNLYGNSLSKSIFQGGSEGSASTQQWAGIVLIPELVRDVKNA